MKLGLPGKLTAGLRRYASMQPAELRQHLFAPDVLTLAGILLLTVILTCLMFFHMTVRRNDPKPPADAPEQLAVHTSEVPLGEYQTIFGSPSAGSGTTQQFVEFEATAVIAGNITEVMQIEKMINNYKNRIRQCVLTTARSATAAELEDVSLARFRERLCKELNTVLQNAPVREVLFTNYRSFGIREPKL